MEQTKSMETKRIVIFLAFTFVVTYAIEIGVIRNLINSTDTTMNVIAQLATAGVMLIPTLGVLFTRIVTKEGFKNHWLKPNLKGNIKYYLIAWFGPAVLTLLGALVYFLVFPKSFDINMSYTLDMYQAQGLEYTVSQLQITIISQVITAVLLAPVLNCIFCFGEEWGWRGYFVPKMKEKMGFIPMVLITGVIWGLWHAPLTAMGHNYGLGYAGYPYLGIFAMCIFCIVMGCIFSFLTLKTGSCIPAIIGHAALNGIASTAIYFTRDGGNNFIGPAPMGCIGGVAFIITAVVMAVLMQRQKSCENKI
ncbi:MAG TPA: type II CAAX endopeptidase family protein [Lachnospiraceae bacterium]|nr:type II CAAX endopeptidase family protein [Lachnospiraceae bacterium]